MKTTKLSIIANSTRIIELLETQSNQAELVAKMRELRRDTLRMEGLVKGLIKVCIGCEKEFKALSTYDSLCNYCKYQR